MESWTITGSPFFSFATFVVVWFAASDPVDLVARWCLPQGSFRGLFLGPAQWWKCLVLMDVWPGDGGEIFDGTENDSVDNELEDFFSFFALGRDARRAVRHLSDGLFDADSHSIDISPSPTGRRLSGRPSKSHRSDKCFHCSSNACNDSLVHRPRMTSSVRDLRRSFSSLERLNLHNRSKTGLVGERWDDRLNIRRSRRPVRLRRRWIESVVRFDPSLFHRICPSPIPCLWSIVVECHLSRLFSQPYRSDLLDHPWRGSRIALEFTLAERSSPLFLSLLVRHHPW